MNKITIYAKVIILLLIIICGVNGMNSQISNEGVFKKYIIKDTLEEKHAVLILYSNGTFLNYGLVNNRLEKDWYIWFTNGNYLSVSGKILLRSVPETYENDQKMLSNIKKYYIWRKDHAFISNYYEYVKENYKDFPLLFSGNNLIDESKKIEYFEKK